jgi:hypothetical protein
MMAKQKKQDAVKMVELLDEMHDQTDQVEAVEAPSPEDRRCPVCLEHGEEHVMTVELDDWICGRCGSRFPRAAKPTA